MSSSSVDWRNRFGWTWLTNIKDQGGCGSCYIFSAVGVFEAMLRIEHSVWCLRSEGDVGDAISLYFGAHAKCQGGSPNEVLDWIKANGAADPGCWPYSSGNQVGKPTPDRLGRTGKLDSYVMLSGAADMKTWIDTNGPITACFSCYPEFDDACKNNEVYIYKNPQNLLPDGHCIVIVGYDDSKKAWLIRNSWGTSWGTNGYGWFGYGQGANGLEYYSNCGILGSSTNPDPWSKRRVHNGNLYESGDGTNHRNFEVWAPGPGNVIRHYYRDGQTQNWSLAETLPQVSLAPKFNTNGYDCAGIPSVLGSTYFRNFEVIYLTTAKQLRQCFFDQLSGKWVDRGPFGPTDAAGIPGFIQINVGAPGNFEVVVRRAAGVLENWWRDNAGNNAQWASKGTFGTGILLSGPTLVQRWAKGGVPDVSVPAGLDLVCVTTGNKMQRWWRDDPNAKGWVACETFGTNVASPPVMIRSQYGASEETVPGNYELCVAVGGSIQHWWASGNPEPTTTATWNLSATFATNVAGQKVQEVLGLIESSYGFDLELIALLTDGSLQHFWRDGAGWHAGPVFGSTLH
ncbi:MAG: C1 family peptidase [Candidatus Solibacter sp.]|jgi:hypothetical protein